MTGIGVVTRSTKGTNHIAVRKVRYDEGYSNSFGHWNGGQDKRNGMNGKMESQRDHNETLENDGGCCKWAAFNSKHGTYRISIQCMCAARVSLWQVVCSKRQRNISATTDSR